MVGRTMEMLKQVKNSRFVLFFFLMSVYGCQNQIVADEPVHFAQNNWMQGQRIETTVEADSLANYDLSFRLRITADYKYHNLFILFKIKDTLHNEELRRYTYKIADDEGQWKGKGSGNIFTYRLPLLKDKRLRKGKYTFSIEHNMRDNPLRGVTDASIVVENAND